MTVLLKVEGLTKSYTTRSGWFGTRRVCALKPTDFQLIEGSTLAIMGANGSGKSTLASLISGAEKPSGGNILLNGQRLVPGNYKQRAQHIRMVFQDAEASLNPNLTLGQQLNEPLLFNTTLTAQERQERVIEVLQQVGLLGEHIVFYPHMMSSGQKQRACIARAIILNPQILVADEALSTLDTSVRAQIINLLLELQKRLRMSYLFISQNPAIVRHLADEVIILKGGEIIERGPVAQVFDNPEHDYTRMLLATS